MVQYFTKAFFDELASQLNADEDFQAKTSDLDLTILNVAKDKGDAFLLTIDGGKVSVEEADPETDAEFKFIGDYDQWVANHEGSSLQKMVMTGKIRFKGSMPKIMRLQSKLKAIDETGHEIDAEY